MVKKGNYKFILLIEVMMLLISSLEMGFGFLAIKQI